MTFYARCGLWIAATALLCLWPQNTICVQKNFASNKVCNMSGRSLRRSCTLQAIFAVLAPGKMVPNLVAGAISEAGAQQAGDMMQDFKCANSEMCMFVWRSSFL